LAAMYAIFLIKRKGVCPAFIIVRIVIGIHLF